MKRILAILLAAAVLALGVGAMAEAGWTCENGHEGNTGNFCSECGSPRPVVSDTWTCVNGHEGNTGNFCSECGAPRPAASDVEWTCANGHGGNTGNFCAECGAPRPGTSAAQGTAPQSAPVYNNPFPWEIELYTTPFEGTIVDHQVALDEFLSHANPGDAQYAVFETRGTASAALAWEKYAGEGSDMYVIYRNGGTDVYAYAYTCEYDASQRTEWAGGTLFPNPINAIGSVLWVESGEDNAVYNTLLAEASENTDYEATRKLIRDLDAGESALWFSHWISMFREELNNGKDRYWVVYHNTAG